MKFNQKLFSLKHATLGATLLSAIAINSVQADTFTFSVDTISPVTIAEIQPLYFGSALNLAAFGVCAFPTLAFATDSWLAVDSNFAVIPAVGGASRALVGAGCADTTSVTSNLGHYLISGGNNTDVKITLVTGGANDGSFTFTPQGIMDNDLAADAADAADLTADTQATITTNASGNVGLLVGGEIEVGLTALTSGTTIPASFDIEVVY